jgi:hypothetical protein
MVRAKANPNKQKEGNFPEWAEHEIKSVQFENEQVIKRSGYILDTYEEDGKIDIQLYEPLADNRTIIEGLDVPKTMVIAEFKKGVVYDFKIRMLKGDLSSKLIEFLKTKFSLDMNSIYRFELEDLQPMDIESDVLPTENLNEPEEA